MTVREQMEAAKQEVLRAREDLYRAMLQEAAVAWRRGMYDEARRLQARAEAQLQIVVNQARE